MEYDEEEYYYPGQNQGAGSKLSQWMALYFRQRKMAYVLSTVALAFLAWWANNWFAPVFFIVIAWALVKIMAKYAKNGNTVVIENRMQGEIITHCKYYQKPIYVPHSWIRIHMVPNVRMKDVHAYGDPTTPVQTQNIVVVDYYEALPNGDILMVYPKDVNFSNFALYARTNPDLVHAMEEVGSARMNNDAFKEVVVEMFHSGKLGEGVEAQERLRALMLDITNVEQKLSKSAAANRSLWLYYKNTIPALHKEVLMLQQELPRMAMAEAAKFTHVLFDHPMGDAVHQRINDLLGDGTLMDYDERVARLVEQQQGGGDQDAVRRNPTEGEAYQVA